MKEDAVTPHKKKTELVRGTLDLLILRTLELRPLHGVAIADRIQQITGGTFVVKDGSLFPALHRLEHKAWIVGRWTNNEQQRRVKSYSLTGAGRRHLAAEKREWNRVVSAMAQVLESS
jgi:transcriptional regulator